MDGGGINALPPNELTNEELFRVYQHWLNAVRDANGYVQTHYAQKRLELVVKESERRELNYHNPYPIRYGCGGVCHHDG